jgi:hypothetical protein
MTIDDVNAAFGAAMKRAQEAYWRVEAKSGTTFAAALERRDRDVAALQALRDQRFAAATAGVTKGQAALDRALRAADARAVKSLAAFDDALQAHSSARHRAGLALVADQNRARYQYAAAQRRLKHRR